MTEDSTGSLGVVEIVTQKYAITGRCYGITDYTRLIDLLNIRDVTHLQLSAVKVRELLHSNEVLAADGPLFLDKSWVVFARSLESPEIEAKRREAHRVDMVERAKYGLLVFAAPFRILGNVHLVQDADLKIALPKLFESFLAMTGAKIIHEDNSDLVWEADFVVVNGGRIEMVSASPPQPKPPEQPPADATSGVEEWEPEEISDLLQPK
ncbi:MAG: hypothetical protein ABR978_08085 [Dehalococcoidia bacterium]|jgi:hypothetical protein